MLSSAFVTSLVFASAEALRVGVISDMHTNLLYDATASVDDNCVASSSAFTSDGQISNDESAPIARIGCDPSTTLVDYMLRRFTEVFTSVDVILVTGDHIAHHVAPHMDEGV